MAEARPILELSKAAVAARSDVTPQGHVTLTLLPGELTLLDARDPRRATWLADLCCGLFPLAEGAIRFLGYDWHRLPYDYAAALRGRIGRVVASGGWIASIDMATNILLPQLHHTRIPRAQLFAEATRIAGDFGLPGLPAGHVDDTSGLDLARSAYVRAFLGRPALLILEDPAEGHIAELLPPLLNAMASARAEGSAVLWLTDERRVWEDRTIGASHRLRLHDYGLRSAGRVAA